MGGLTEPDRDRQLERSADEISDQMTLIQKADQIMTPHLPRDACQLFFGLCHVEAAGAHDHPIRVTRHKLCVCVRV